MEVRPESSFPIPLERAEYIEQEHFFRVLRERTAENVPLQEALGQIREEILATTKLPLAIEYLQTESLHGGRLGPAMKQLSHYFTPFQTFVIVCAESDTSRFDMPIALLILERLAGFMANNPSLAGLFIYQFECVSRNRLGYDSGLLAVAADPCYEEDWTDWIRRLRSHLGTADFCDLIYFRSEDYVDRVRARSQRPDWYPEYPVFFGQPEGRIARASRGKDPLFMFAALQRQLDYPRIPRIEPKKNEALPPNLEARLLRTEQRVTLLEAETKGPGIDLNEFMKRHEGSGGWGEGETGG